MILSPIGKAARETIAILRILEIFINRYQFGSVDSGCDTIGSDDSFHNLRRISATQGALVPSVV